MLKLLLIAREEILFNLRQGSFFIATLLMVVIFVAAGAFPRLQEAAAATPLSRMETILSENESILESVGFVDKADLVIEIPEAQRGLTEYGDEEAAQLALEQGQIEAFYLIPADYIASGNVTLISANPQLINDTDRGIQIVLRHNLLRQSQPAELADRVTKPYVVEWRSTPPPTFSFLPTEVDYALLSTAALVAGLFVYMINTSGFLLLGALQREAEARIMEVLITSTSAVQFIGGKILGLSALSFMQVGLSLCAGLLVYGGNPDGSGPATIPLYVLVAGLPYLVLGFLTFSSIMLIVVVLFPNLGESMQLQLFIRIMILSPLIGVVFILPNPYSQAAVFLTLLPISSPLLMPFRLFIATVPPWQIGLSLSMLILWTAGLFWFSTRIFRANTLLTGRMPTPRALWQALTN